MAEAEQPDLTNLTVQLLSAYVSNNTVASGDLAGLIKSTRLALAEETAAPAPAEPEFVPAVSVRKSLGSREHILSMIDGKPYKSLKRHLSAHGLTTDEYRARYNLPRDYPMVAPAYSEHRRQVAKQLGLGRRKASAPAAVSEKASAAKPQITGEAKKTASKGTSAATPAVGRKAAATSKPKTAQTQAASTSKTNGRAPAPSAKNDATAKTAKPARTQKAPARAKPAQKRGRKAKAEAGTAPAE